MSNFARFMQAAAGGSSSSSGGGGGLNRSPSGTQDTSGHHANTLFHIQTSGETGDVRSVTDQSGSSHTVDYDYGSQIGSFNPFTENYTTNENAKNDDWITVSGDVDYGAPKLDYLRFTHDSSFDFGTGNFTIETWIYPLKNPPGDQFLFMQTGSGNNKFMW